MRIGVGAPNAAGQEVSSPRTRGCSRRRRDASPADDVLPAHAGLFRPRGTGMSVIGSPPRARGAVPPSTTSEHGRRSSSPRTRGCSRGLVLGDVLPVVLPAHAGLFRSPEPGCPSPNRPPRARGAVPEIRAVKALSTESSPRTRGCSAPVGNPAERIAVLPAHAGLFRAQAGSGPPPRRPPRALGAVPSSTGAAGADSRSPRACGTARDVGCFRGAAEFTHRAPSSTSRRSGGHVHRLLLAPKGELCAA